MTSHAVVHCQQPTTTNQPPATVYHSPPIPTSAASYRSPGTHNPTMHHHITTIENPEITYMDMRIHVRTSLSTRIDEERFAQNSLSLLKVNHEVLHLSPIYSGGISSLISNFGRWRSAGPNFNFDSSDVWEPNGRSHRVGLMIQWRLR